MSLFCKFHNISSNINNQWTTIFGENISRIIFESKGFKLKRTKNINENEDPDIRRKQPDWIIIDDNNDIIGIVEIKSRTYTTSGTIGEKIFYPVIKYDNYIEDKRVPFFIICLGYQEIEAHFDFHLFDNSKQIYNIDFIRDYLDLLKTYKKFYLGASCLFHIDLNTYF